MIKKSKANNLLIKRYIIYFKNTIYSYQKIYLKVSHGLINSEKKKKWDFLKVCKLNWTMSIQKIYIIFTQNG